MSDGRRASAFPESLQRQISGIINNCNGVLGNIGTILEKHGKNRVDRNAKWVLGGREEVNRLRSSLEAHKTALEIALDMVQLNLSRDIKATIECVNNDTAIIMADTGALRQGMTELLREIARLKAQVARQAGEGVLQEGASTRDRDFILETYLNDLSTYAESIVSDEETEKVNDQCHSANECQMPGNSTEFNVPIRKRVVDESRIHQAQDVEDGVNRSSEPVELPDYASIEAMQALLVSQHTSQTLPQNTGRQACLLVAVEFGNTTSSVAWAVVTNSEAKEDIITEWPGSGNCTRLNIPTVIYYDSKLRVCGWGSDSANGLAPSGFPKPGVSKVEWLPLRIFIQEKSYINPIELPPLPPGKTAIAACADYLFHLRVAVQNVLQRYLGEFFNKEAKNIHWIFTYPSFFSATSQAAFQSAIDRAGFFHDRDDQRLSFISCLEALALFCSKSGFFDDANIQYDTMLILDCGKSTVDLSTFKIVQQHPFAVAECTVCSGSSYGSNALNYQFSHMIRQKIGRMKLPNGSKSAAKVYARSIIDFETRIKSYFRNNGQKWAIDVDLETEFPEAGIEDGYLLLTNEDILQCFQPVVEGILGLIRNQMIAIKSLNRSVHSIIIAGEFGANEFLFNRIKSDISSDVRARVLRPMDVSVGVVRGALAMGINRLFYGSHAE